MGNSRELRNFHRSVIPRLVRRTSANNIVRGTSQVLTRVYRGDPPPHELESFIEETTVEEDGSVAQASFFNTVGIMRQRATE